MAENAYAKTFGSSIKYGNTGTTPATLLAGIKAIRSMPQLIADEIDITRIDQLDEMKHFAPSLGDPGTLGLTLGFKKADIVILYGLYRVPKAWLMTFSDLGTTTASTLAFDGWIKQIGKEAPKGDEVVVNVDIRVSGAHTFVAGT
jgi:hypothetical protein